MLETPPNLADSPEVIALVLRARAWAAADPDPVSQAELAALIEARNYPELHERMAGDLEFGTAGLRGVVGAGSARMNLAVVIRVTRALAEQLLSRAQDARVRPVVVGCDARLDSTRFADAAARVLIAAGIPVKRFQEPVPTPFVAYAVRVFAANAGVMITASHNPPEYNGYKLYSEHGVQVIAPTDREVVARMNALGPAKDVPLGHLARQELIGVDVAARYFAEVRGELPRVVADRKFAIVYTPLHGVGASVVERLFAEAGYADFRSVPEQREPDGHFPTVPFPNPEEPGALDLAIALAVQSKAELLIANDPDVDRLAIAVPTPSGLWLALTGNQIGLLLADFALAHGDAGPQALVLSSLVSSPMLESIAAAHGARCERVLTGFKWVWTAALALEARSFRFCFGYEEALGYSFGRAVRDKDGISAALAFAELAAEARAAGKTVLERLHALYREHGLWVSVLHNVVLKGAAGAARILQAMQQAVDSPPAALAGLGVSSVTDLRQPEASAPSWRGAALLVEIRLIGGGRVFVRPSGTEPKLKIYVDLRADLAPEASLSAAEDQARSQALDVARALVSSLGLD
ncbi:MAG TPA: phospho-sugar mutase [Polyangiaceae bacterium]|jgi:phosphomannomutase|nr:phospho-sugar mutase [Polyangiaceae bacterium]